MRGLPQARWTAGAAVLAIALSACGGSSGSDNPSAGSTPGGSSGGAASGHVNIVGSEPQNPLVGLNTNETGGGQIVDAITTGLVNYSPDDASLVMAVAKSIDTTDNTTFKITLNDNYKFSDGTPVNAKSFVDAWNYGAYGPNAQLNSYFFEPITGYTEVQGEDKNGDKTVTADEAPVKEMSGLTVDGDFAFTVKLDAPASTFPQRLGYSAFVPLPTAFFSDPKGFGEKPVTNGPFKFVSWQHDVAIDVTADPTYVGPDKAKVKDITFKVYQNQDAAYADLLADNVDVMDVLPTAALAGDTYKQDLGDRVVEQAIGTSATITLPEYVDAYKNPDLGKAISMAIDRDAIIKNIFNNARIPADGWVSPVVDGYVKGQCDYCTYDPAKAKAMLAQAGGFKGTLTLSYNADGDHKAWTEATCNSIKNALGVPCQAKPYVDFATFRDAITKRQMTGMFRTGWQMDYPSIENFLAPLYATGAGSNDGEYSNPKFDALLKEAAAAEGDAGLAKYQQAEKLLNEQMAIIPMWFGKLQAGYSNNVNPVKFTPFGTPDLSGLSVK